MFSRGIIDDFNKGGYDARMGAVPVTKPSQEIIIQRGPNWEFKMLHHLFGQNSTLTDFQKTEVWKTYEGRFVEWTGTVLDVGKDILGDPYITFKQLPTTETYDVQLMVGKGMESKLMGIKKGQTLTYRGRLYSQEGLILGYILKDGVF